MLHFFESLLELNSLPLKNIKFKCKICEAELVSKLNKSSNLFMHLCVLEETQNWHENYKKFRSEKSSKLSELDNETFNLIKYFISSNTSLCELQNKYFRKIIDKEVKLPCYYTFRNQILPVIMQKLYASIEQKLIKAATICLIVDIWTDKMNVSFRCCYY